MDGRHTACGESSEITVDIIWAFMKAMTFQNIVNVFTVLGVLASLYKSVYVPWKEAKPDIEFFTTPHYIGNDTAVNSMLIRNKGKGAATNIGIYCELKRPHIIKKIRSNLDYKLVEGGEDDWRVKMTWKRLEPKNSINVALLIEADPMDISSIIPEVLRIWSDKGIIEEQGML